MSLILLQETASSVPTPPAGKGTVFLNATDQIVIKDSAGNTSSFLTLSASGNTQVTFNDAGAVGGDSTFVFNKTNDTLTVSNLSVTGTLVAGDIAVSSIANGTSNVDIVGVSGNVTVSVAGNANILTVTGTGANISGTFSASGNANAGNIGTAGVITATGNITGGNLVTSGLISATGNVTASAVIANGTIGNGIVGGALTSGTTKGTGVTGQAYVTSSTDSGAATGVRGYAISTHSGGFNIGVLGNASGSGLGNYAFYVQEGNIATIENVAVWDLYDNSATSLSWQSSGKANILRLDTLDGAEGVSTSGYLSATGNANVGNLGTAGLVVATGNVTGGNLTTGGLITATGNVTGGNLTTGGLITATGNVTGGNVTTAGQLVSSIAIGTAPLIVTSTTRVSNLNVATAGTADTATSATTAGTVTTAAQPNITSVGTLSSLSVTANANVGNLGTATAIITTGNITTINSGLMKNGNSNVTITANGNVSTYITGNVTPQFVIAATGTNTAGYSNVVGNANVGNLGTAGLITATGNVTGGNLVTGGVLSVTGNANVGNIGAAAGVFTANVSANNLSTTNRVTAGNGVTVSTGGASITGNLDITGNLNVTGNVNYSNVTDLVVGDPLIYLGANNTGNLYDLGIVASYNDGTYKHTGVARDHNNGYWTFYDGVVAEPTTTIDWANAIYPTVKTGPLISTSTISATGNANVSNLGTARVIATGNISATQLISNIATGTAPLVVTSTTQVANLSVATAGSATTAGTVTTAAQGNITSVGTLTGLGVNGTITAVAITANTGVFTGNGSGLSAIAGANVTGTVANATYAVSAGSAGTATTAGTVTTNAQPNITSVGTLTSLTLGGTLTGAVQIGTGAATHFGTTLTTGANTTAGTVTGNWTLSAGSKLNATYADLAEKYVADAAYEPGTVLVFGGEHEVTISSELNSTRVAGVVTTNPAYTMNNECEGEHVATLALQGRVPCKVVGPIYKGDLLVSAGNGYAIANNEARAGTLIGKSLQNFTDATGLIEVAVGRF